MKFEQEEPIEDASAEEIVKPVEVETGEKEHMLDYNNIKSSQDIEVPPLLIDQVIGHEESI